MNVQINKPKKEDDKIIYNIEVNKEISYIKVSRSNKAKNAS